MNINIERYDDHQYRVHAPWLKRDVLFSVDDADGQNEFELVEAVAKAVVDAAGVHNERKVSFHNRTWKLVPEDLGMLKKAVASLTSFVHLPSDLGPQQFKIVRGRGRTSEQQESLHLQKLRDRVPGATDAQLTKGVRLIASLEAPKKPFNDAFTQLASFAYSHAYERHYSAKDNVTPEQCDSCIIVSEGSALLVLGRNKELVTPQASKAAVVEYKDYLYLEYGKDKVDSVQRAFGIDFEKMQILTPEHVYRMNIGLRSVDVDDVSDLLKKLPLLVEHIRDKREISLEELSEKTGIARYILGQVEQKCTTSKSPAGSNKGSDTESGADSSNSPTSSMISTNSFSEGISEWLDQFDTFPKKLEDCTEAEFEILMQPFTLDAEASDRAYTGRKIRKPLLSGYSTAELGQEKLWVDRQELAQAFEVMANTSNLDLWLEKLDHVVVKANMLKGVQGYNNDTVFAVGVLIPAPLGEEGEKRWYRVTRCISNGYGIFTYTLEPAAKNSSLAALFVARSTASSEYALHGQDSLLNDLNALNPPGYEGQMLSAPYDSKFFAKHTIPIWVGHTLHGKKLLDAGNMPAAITAFRQANKALQTNFVNKLANKNLGMLAREYDWLLNRIGLELKLDNLVTSGYLSTYQKIMKNYVEGVASDDEPKDASRLLAQLENVQVQFSGAMEILKEKKQKLVQKAEKNELGEVYQQIKEIDVQLMNFQYLIFGSDRLIGELKHYITERHYVRAEGHLFNQFMTGDYAKLSTLENQVLIAREHGYDEQAADLVQKWYLALNERADNDRELPKYKGQTGLIVTGQSLGGAISQVAISRQLVRQGRIPVKEVHAYTISSPGIRRVDQEAFIDYVSDTALVREAIGSKIKITHLTESADLVFLAGQGHIASAHNQDEEEKLKSIEFRCEVREMVAGKMAYKTVHETQFMEGIVGEHYNVHSLSPRELALMDDASHFVSKNIPDKEKLSLEAKAQKERYRFARFLDEKIMNKIPKNSLHLRRHLHQQRKLAPGSGQLDGQGVFIAE